MVSKILVAICVLVVVATAIPAGPGAWPPGFGRPGWGVNPWIPAWAPCTTIGAACLDCNTKVVCTKIGGIEKACSDPTLPYCNLGQCSATPSAECAIDAPASAGAA